MKSKLNRLRKIGLSNQAIAKELKVSIKDIKKLNSNDNRFLDLMKVYNKKIADK